MVIWKWGRIQNKIIFLPILFSFCLHSVLPHIHFCSYFSTLYPQGLRPIWRGKVQETKGSLLVFWGWWVSIRDCNVWVPSYCLDDTLASPWQMFLLDISLSYTFIRGRDPGHYPLSSILHYILIAPQPPHDPINTFS